MPEGYRVEVTFQAQQSMHEIVGYIAHDLAAPGAAERLRRDLMTAICGLDFMPARVPLTPEEPWRSWGLHRLLARDYYIYFWIDEPCHWVLVTDVIPVRMDQLARLYTMLLL